MIKSELILLLDSGEVGLVKGVSVGLRSLEFPGTRLGLHLALGRRLLLLELVKLPLLVLVGADDLIRAIYVQGLGPLELAGGIADVFAKILDLLILWITFFLLLNLSISFVKLSFLGAFVSLTDSRNEETAHTSSSFGYRDK